MKKIILTLAALSILAACSSNPEKLQTANDTFQKSKIATPKFFSLANGGITLPKADNTYALPQINFKKETNVDIRPPSIPLAFIKNSLTQFDGERAMIIYSAQQTNVYNLRQIARLLKEEGIDSTINGSILTTEWAKLGDSDTEIKYQFEQVFDRNFAALTTLVLQMRHDGVIFTPSIAEKQRYTSERLNRLVSNISSTYSKQQQDLSNTASVGAVQSSIIQDMNGQIALEMNITFSQAWEKLSYALPKAGFTIESEIASKGYRELKYSALDKEDWLRLGVDKPELENGKYQMQISAHGHQSSVVISDKKGNALTGGTAQQVYQAIGNLIAY